MLLLCSVSWCEWGLLFFQDSRLRIVGTQSSAGCVIFFVVVVCVFSCFFHTKIYIQCVWPLCSHRFHCWFQSCSMETVRRILSTTGCIKRKVKRSTGRWEIQIGTRDTGTEAAHERKERNIRKKRGTRCLTGKWKTDTERSGTRKDSIMMRRGAAVTQIKGRDLGEKSTGEGKRRYHCFPCQHVEKVAQGRLIMLQFTV